MTKSKHDDRVLKLARRQAVVTARDLKMRGIPDSYLTRNLRAGTLERVARGMYSSPDLDLHPHRTKLEICVKMPHAVICLCSALRFHDFTTVTPHEVWIALPRNSATPRATYPPVRIVRVSDPSYHYGVQRHRVLGQTIRVYSPAKTVADCWKFRRLVGTELAIEALRECLREKKATRGEIWAAAKVCRVQNIMFPYMQAMS